LPLLDDEAELVTSDVHDVEVSVKIKTVDFIALELDPSQCYILGVTSLHISP
jgi:hypothetical protein